MIPPKSMTPPQARHWPDAQLSAGLYELNSLMERVRRGFAEHVQLYDTRQNDYVAGGRRSSARSLTLSADRTV